MNRAKTLLDPLALDHRYLTICDAVPTFEKEPIREAAAEAKYVLNEGGNQDDDSDPEQQGDGAAGARGLTPPTPAEKKKSQDVDLRMWLPLRPHSIAWNDLGI